MAYCPLALRRQPDHPCRMPPSSPLEVMIPSVIGAGPARMSTRLTRVERQLHSVAHAFAAAGGSPRMPRGATLLCPSVREADAGPKPSQMAVYRGGICAALPHERRHMRLFAGFLAVGLGPYWEPTARSSNGFRPLTRNYSRKPECEPLDADA